MHVCVCIGMKLYNMLFMIYSFFMSAAKLAGVGGVSGGETKRASQGVDHGRLKIQKNS